MFEVRATIGENIRRAREQAGLQQNEFADRLGTSPTTVHKWEADKVVPDLVSLVKVAILLKRSLESLVVGFSPEYDRMRQAAPLPEQFADLWPRVAPDGQQTLGNLLRLLAGLPAGEAPRDNP